MTNNVAENVNKDKELNINSDPLPDEIREIMKKLHMGDYTPHRPDIEKTKDFRKLSDVCENNEYISRDNIIQWLEAMEKKGYKEPICQLDDFQSTKMESLDIEKLEELDYLQCRIKMVDSSGKEHIITTLIGLVEALQMMENGDFFEWESLIGEYFDIRECGWDNMPKDEEGNLAIPEGIDTIYFPEAHDWLSPDDLIYLPERDKFICPSNHKGNYGW